ncbi:vesicle-associated membrane protein 8-like [Clinocottus analis]|uniref:vesicle-associated membrane protein 8-like n=1 Tax=Clinocottus analis TaxID=304258 RepID=UPI0035C112AF
MTCDRLSTNTARDEADMEQGGVAEAAPQDKTQVLRDQADKVIEKMKENVNGIIEREKKAEDLLRKSEDMENGAQQLMQTSRKVARTYWWKNAKLVVVIVVVVLVIILIIILLATRVIPIGASAPPAVTPTTKP